MMIDGQIHNFLNEFAQHFLIGLLYSYKEHNKGQLELGNGYFDWCNTTFNHSPF